MTNPDFNFDTMSQADFERNLPEFFATGGGRVSSDPRLRTFLEAHPDCAALVRDLETIAEHARSLFDPADDPSDAVWARIQTSMEEDPVAFEGSVSPPAQTGTQSSTGPISRNGEPTQTVTGGSLHDLD